MDAAEPTRAPGAGRVLAIGFALLVFAGALFWIGSGLMAKPLDGAAEQERIFGDTPVPFGFVLDSAVRLPTGGTLVRFTREEEAGREPDDLLFLEYTDREAAAAQLAGTMLEGTGGAEGRLKEWEQEKAFDWSFTLERGDFSFGDWSTKYLIERRYAKGGTWNEEARVDLSTPARALVMFLHWPPETSADEGMLREILLAVEMPAAE